MKKEGTLGAATLLAIAAVMGFSVQTGPKPAQTGRGDPTALGKRVKPTMTKPKTPNDGPGCGSLREELQGFLEIRDADPQLVVPDSCNPEEAAKRRAAEQPEAPETSQQTKDKHNATQNEGQKAQQRAEKQSTPSDLAKKTSQLKFIIATLPDPVHTHLAVLFDQLTVAIQEGAQDENYDFDSACLPSIHCESRGAEKSLSSVGVTVVGRVGERNRFRSLYRHWNGAENRATVPRPVFCKLVSTLRYFHGTDIDFEFSAGMIALNGRTQIRHSGISVAKSDNETGPARR